MVASRRSHLSDHERARPGDPDYGPAGYVPPKAAKRARKVVLRAPMGLAWVIAPLVVGVVLVAVAVVFFTTR